MRITLLWFFFRSRPNSPPHWSPLPESDPAQAEKAAYLVLAPPNLWVGEEVSQAEIPGLHGAGHAGKKPQDDGRTGQDVVSKQKDQMEVRAYANIKDQKQQKHFQPNLPLDAWFGLRISGSKANLCDIQNMIEKVEYLVRVAPDCNRSYCGIALVDILDLSEVDIPAGVFLHPAVGWGWGWWRN